ncbi:MAG TPA: cupin domain-containing protein [Gaiellaceae bacterium]|nr:cupin domain-containing protein [Gaiellaceae bacterium]
MIAERLAGRTIGGVDGTFVVAEWADRGDTSRERPIAPLHLHRSEDEAWYILEGRLGFRAGDDELEAGPGGAVLVPAGLSHTYWNAGGGPARYLLVMGPQTARLIEAIHAMDPFDPARLPDLFREHDSELLA